MTQKEALDILKTGRDVFLTGAAGSGKTHVLNEYLAYLRSLNANVGITASTGIAATHMGGTTIHSWSGLGIRDTLQKSDLDEIANKKRIRKNIEKSSVLIIDEISMLHHFRLDMVDSVIRRIKDSKEPFGGIQVVFCGDFFQLPPVRRAGEPEALFVYHSEIWKNLNLKVCYLSEQHRQSEAEFLAVLNSVRENNVTDKVLSTLKKRFLDQEAEAENHTKLYSHNKNVDEENERELSKIPGKPTEYEMHSKGRQSMVQVLKKSCLAPENLRLKVGAKVMFVKNNFDEGYVNGTLGYVTKCNYEEIWVKTDSGRTIEVEKEKWRIEEDGKTLAEITQYPLRLAWAITVHKSQGMSLDSALIDLSKSFERGMGYVALSRVRSLEGLFLKGLNHMALKVSDEALEMDKKFKKLSDTNSFHIRTMGESKIAQMHGEFARKIGVKNSEIPKEKTSTADTTKDMLDQGLGIKEVARKRGLKLETVLDHLEQIKKDKPDYNIYNLRNSIPKNKFRTIYSAFRKVGISEGGLYKLAPVKEALGSKFSYEDLRLVRLFL